MQLQIQLNQFIYNKSLGRLFFVSKKVPLGTSDVNFSFFTYFPNKGKIMIASAFHLKFRYSEKKVF